MNRKQPRSQGDPSSAALPLLLATLVCCTVQAESADSASSAQPSSKKATGHVTEEFESYALPAVSVIGDSDALENISGSGYILDKKELFESHVFTTNEALRKIPGVNVRDEEGFGMRPNIGIRGLNPTRSTRVLLLEDGLPLSYAPYGDNASYYHPPIDRFERIEVLKGANQIQFGPQTAGGVINYITPVPPGTPQGFASFVGGNRNYLNGHVNYGGTVGRFGGLFDFIHKEGDGARDNVFSEIDDVNAKAVYQLSDSSSLILRGNYFQEDSQVTYSGITDAEARNFGLRYNPFKNDTFMTSRWGTSATHEYRFNDQVKLTTSFYFTHFQRDWWRQASTTTDSQCGSAFVTARQQGQLVDVDACNSAQGRLRDYYTYGVEPRLHASYDLLGIPSELDLGFRAHFEEQFRTQVNGRAPTARGGELREKNERFVDAISGFAQNRFYFGKWSVTPGVRVESIDFERVNRLDPTDVRRGKTSLTETLPAFGINYNPNDAATVFFGFHRGFAPPRTEDAVSNTGLLVDVDAEKSWNYELGVRTRPWTGVQLDATLYRMDFENQVVVGSIAGGSTPLAQGEALYQGIEFFNRIDFGTIFETDHNVYLQAAYTWVADAETLSPFRCVAVDGAIPGACSNGLVPGSVAGNRLPYAPEHLVTATVGYSHPSGFDFHLETVLVDEQFADFHNAVGQTLASGAPSLTGQNGRIDDYVIVNLGSTYRIKPWNTDVFVTVKNLFDREYIVDRTRGILPGSPLLVQAGFRLGF